MAAIISTAANGPDPESIMPAARKSASNSWFQIAVAIVTAAGMAAVCIVVGLGLLAPTTHHPPMPHRALESLEGCTRSTPRPVFIMHGLQGNVASTTQLAAWIRNAYPGTETYQFPYFEDDDSFTPLLQQLPTLADYIRDTVAKYPTSFESGYDLVGYSQGGLICRALVQYMDDHNVHTLISLAGPQMGVYGPHVRSEANQYLQDAGIPGANIDDYAYLPVVQNMLSAANLWNDPTRREVYLEQNVFLPVYNGLTDDAAGNEQRKANFLRLTKAVFMIGDFTSDTWDGGVEPWQSGVFGFYKDGSTTDVTWMSETEEYKTDSFGLKTLNEGGRLVAVAVPEVTHPMWVSDVNVVSQEVLPVLGDDCQLSPDDIWVAPDSIVSTTSSSATSSMASTTTTTVKPDTMTSTTVTPYSTVSTTSLSASSSMTSTTTTTVKPSTSTSTTVTSHSKVSTTSSSASTMASTTTKTIKPLTSTSTTVTPYINVSTTSRGASSSMTSTTTTAVKLPTSTSTTAGGFIPVPSAATRVQNWPGISLLVVFIFNMLGATSAR